MLKVMREGRPRAVRSRPGLVPGGVALLASLFASASGCATEVSTLEPTPPESEAGSGGTAGQGSSGAPTGGKAPTAGSTASGGSGGTGVNAFGGTATSGGKPSGGASGAGGATAGSAQGGSAQGGAAGGASQAGSGGKGGASQAGYGGMSGSGSGGSAGSASNLECLKDWKASACDTCSTQTQGDKLACIKILDCYAANACGPATCSSNDDKCGANKIGQGTAGYPIAKQVYDCACQ